MIPKLTLAQNDCQAAYGPVARVEPNNCAPVEDLHEELVDSAVSVEREAQGADAHGDYQQVWQWSVWITLSKMYLLDLEYYPPR